MELESDPNTNFESVDMAIFFWIGIAFIVLYRVCVFMWAVYNWLCRGEGDWYDVILCILDLYIFKAVYESFSEAQGVITKNAEKRKKNRQRKEQKKKQKQMERTVELAEAGKNVEEIKQILQEEEEQELEPGEIQFFMQLGESIVEAMPQIVLQSVFIIRSGNDPELVKESNIWLVMLSVIASLFSIASKFIFLDKNFVYEKAKSLKFSPNCPRCINYWYLCRLMWRMCNIGARFSVFVLLWTVLGGRWLPIFLFLSWLSWTIYACWWQTHNDDADPEETAMISIIFIVAVLPLNREVCHWLTIRSIENVFAMVLVTIFAAIKFKCQFNFCSEPDDRQLIGNDNERVLIFWSLGWLSLIVEALLFAVMYFNEIFTSDEQYFCDEKHGKYLKMSGIYNQTVTMCKSKLKSDDTDIDLPNSAYFYFKRALKHSSPAIDHKIRIDTLSNKGNDDILIGIAWRNGITNESFVIDPKLPFYAYSNAGNAIKSVEIPAEEQQTDRYYVETKTSGDGYGEGDIVTIRWNQKIKNLQYFVNDKKQCSFECGRDIYSYIYPVVSLRNHGDAISVIGTKFVRASDILSGSTNEVTGKKSVPELAKVDDMLEAETKDHV